MNTQSIGDISNSHVENLNNIGGINVTQRTTSNEHNKKKWGNPIAIMLIANGIFALTNIIIASIYLPRDVHLGIDYIGVIVALFSLIVLLLIGWNVYSVIDVRHLKEDYSYLKSEYNNLLIEMKEAEDKRDKSVRQLKGMLYSISGAILSEKDTINYLQAFEHHVYSLYNYLLSDCKTETVDSKLERLTFLLEKIHGNEEFESEEIFMEIIKNIKEKALLDERQLDKFVEITIKLKEKLI